MIQAYSSNLAVSANTPFSFNNVVVDKGCSVSLIGTQTFQINKRGIYLIEMDGFATPDAATAVSVQLYVNNVAQPQAISQFTPASVTDERAFGFKTFVRVADNNCQCNILSAPTVLQFMNGITDISDAHINVVITQIH